MHKPPATPLSAADVIALNRFATTARLLPGAAHAVNNALQVIGGTVELLEDQPDRPPEDVEGLRIIREQALRAADALEEVMAFVRARSDDRGRIDFHAIVAQAVAMRTYAATRAGIALRLLSPRVPLLVDGNAHELTQLVINLITNAEDASAPREGSSVQVEAFEEGDWVVMRVSDEGGGVKPEMVGRLFDALSTTRPRPDSSGLGLTAARIVAESHGGTLELEPADRGARFTLRLPTSRRADAG
jgi:signal transduction histidine kinase